MSQNKTDLPSNEPNPVVTEPPEAADQSAEVHAAGWGRGKKSAQSDVPQGQADDAIDAYVQETARAQQDDATAAADDVDTLREALVRKVEEAERYRDQALRAAAEADNVRKRSQRDVEAARKFALEKFAGELLGVRDSLDMGLKASADEQADLKHVIEGMELTARMLASAMEKFGVEIVNPEGEVFDPELHEAVSTQQTDAQAPNTVVAVVQKGYTLNGRVLRAAMVVVAQAPSDKA